MSLFNRSLILSILEAGDKIKFRDQTNFIERPTGKRDGVDVRNSIKAVVFVQGVEIPPEPPTEGLFQKISAKNSHSLAVAQNETLWAWGQNAQGKTGLNTIAANTTTPTQVGTDTNWLTVSAGLFHSLGIKTDGTLWAWGSNTNGLTGLGLTTGNTTTPTQVGTDTDWLAVATGGQHSHGIKTNGTLWAWGSNANGRTGLGIIGGDTTTPAQVGLVTSWSKVAIGWSHSHAIRADGTLYAWGGNSNGLTGLGLTTGNTTAPTRVGTDTDWLEVSAQLHQTHAIKTNRTLWGWGRVYTQENYLIRTTPTQIGSDLDWQSIACGTINSSGSPSFNTAIKTNGTLWAWGHNNGGATGLGLTSGITFSPTQVETDADWQKIETGTDYSLALKTNGTLYAWGRNLNGRTGLSSSTTTPTQVPIELETETETESAQGGPVPFILWAYVNDAGWSQLASETTTERGVFEIFDCGPFDRLYLQIANAQSVKIARGRL